MKTAALLFGYSAVTLSCLIVIPQMIQTLKTRNTVNISLITFLIFTVANTFWLTFGILTLTVKGLAGKNPDPTWSLVLIIPYSIQIVCAIVILVIKFDNLKKARIEMRKTIMEQQNKPANILVNKATNSKK